MSQHYHVEAFQAARRSKKRKQADPNSSNKVAQAVPESPLFNRLVKQEQQIDLLLDRKRAEIRQSVDNPPLIHKKIRIYLYNTYQNQLEEPAGWTVYIGGRVLNRNETYDGKDALSMQYMQQDEGVAPFTAYIKSVKVQMQSESNQGQGELILWNNAPGNIPKHLLELSRTGDQNVELKVTIELRQNPGFFTIRKPLAKLLGCDSDKLVTRAEIIRGVWGYIRQNGLQNDQNPSMIDCDETMKAALGDQQSSIGIQNVMTKLQYMYTSTRAVNLTYQVKVGGDSPTHPVCYDIDMDVPVQEGDENVGDAAKALFQRVNHDTDIHAQDVKINGCLLKLRERQRRRTFFLGFSQNPSTFISNLVNSQAIDLYGAGTKDFEKMKTNEFFHGKWVEDAVMRYMQRHQNARASR